MKIILQAIYIFKKKYIKFIIYIYYLLAFTFGIDNAITKLQKTYIERWFGL